MTGPGRRRDEWPTPRAEALLSEGTTTVTNHPDAASLGRDIETGAADPRDLAEAHITAIEAHEDAGLIYARTTFDAARAEAAAAADRAKRGLRRHPLDGVPVSWKDLYDTAGVATESGSALLRGRTPDRDAVTVARGRRAGLVSLGKTHQTELAFSGLGVNPVTATPPNAVRPGAAPGGSSSGAASSVAFGLAAIGFGSDTGGSVRIPSVWQSLVGLKTTHGLVPGDGLVPLCARFDTAGPLCRTVEDAALSLSVLAAERPADLTGATLQGASLAVLETVALDDQCRDAPRAAFEAAVERLAAAGARVTRIEAAEVADAMALASDLFTAEAWATWGDLIEDKGDLMHPPVRARFEVGREVNGAAYAAAWAKIGELRAAWADRVAGFDAVLIPTSPILPPEVSRLLADDDFFTSENLLALRNTRIGNLLGLCGLTMPTPTPSCGVQFMGRAFDEARLLRIGAAAERIVAET